MLQLSKSWLLLITFLVLVTFPALSQSYSSQRQPVIVSVYDSAGVSSTVLAQAELEASRILERAGMAVLWVNCTTPEISAVEEACNRFFRPGHLSVRIMPHSIHSAAEIFGVAFLSADGTGRYSDVFYDRALELHSDWKVGLGNILGNVVAHELGHLLLGSNAHSSAGIMRARWYGEELHRMARGGLGFSTEQAERMRERLSGARPAVARLGGEQ